MSEPLFDLPSDECIGCGSCHYVCPTGSMNMEYENALRWRSLPGPMRKCRYMRMGYISHKICPNNFQCWICEYDQRMEDIADTHPIFLLKQERAEEKEMIGPFKILFDRFYHEGHVWVKPVGGLLQMGIDDFTRQILGVVSDLKLPSLRTVLEADDNLFEILGNDKALRMFSPIDGMVVDINSDILDNPTLAGIAPYDRGWMLTVEPADMLQVSKDLLSGRSAREWLKLESQRFIELIEKETEPDLRSEKTIPKDFAKTISKEIWKKIQKTFFTKKRKKKTVKLYRLEDLH